VAESFLKIEHRFVKVYDQEHNRVVFTGLITGFVVGASGIGVRANVYDLQADVQRVISFEYLRVVGVDSIHEGLEGLRAHHPIFGDGIISHERRPDNMLEVKLRALKGDSSPWYPLYEVTVLGPQPRRTVPAMI